MRTPRLISVLLLTLLLLACNQPVNWHATDVTGMMPDLEFTLTAVDGKVVNASAAVFAFDAEGRAKLLISDVNDSDAVVSDIRQLIDL